MPLTAGIDIGGSTTEALVSSSSGGLRAMATLSSRHGGEATVAVATAALDEALAMAGRGRADLHAIGVGVPGRVDIDSGDVRLAVNLGIGREGFPLGAKLESELGVPTVVDHDMRIAALGAFEHVRATRKIANLAFIGVGTGVSVGLVLGGSLYRGALGFAGEIGHVIVDPNGPRCQCGLVGCLEAVLTSPAQGTPAHQTDRASRYLAWAVHMVTMTYDVDVVVLGGGVVRAGGRVLVAATRGELERLAAASTVAEAALYPDRVITLPTDFNPGVEGAVALARLTIERKQPK